MPCPCGSAQNFEDCCQPLIEAKRRPATAEALMRSRYCAYVVGNIEYVRDTLAPEVRKKFELEKVRESAKSVTWKSLKILSTEKGGENDRTGTVEFVATYEYDGETLEQHEVSQFRKDADGQWLYVEGDPHTHRAGESHSHAPGKTVVRAGAKVGRNDPCPCGSGKKYKKCCGPTAA